MTYYMKPGMPDQYMQFDQENKQTTTTSKFGIHFDILNEICDSTYGKLPVVGRLDFELWGCKVKRSQNIVSKSILRFHI